MLDSNKKIGIYKITNKINNMSYIGASKDIEKRFVSHKRNSTNVKLKNDLNNYGIDNFTFEILEECSIENIRDRELFYIENSDLENTYNSKSYCGYNGKPLCVDLDKFSIILKEKRESLGLNFRELAKLIPCKESVIYNLEWCKTHASKKMIKRICQVLEIDI
jgi:group I intron endonuclease